ncbi:MAG: alpha/beta fold hydrolase [Actinomycetota bacterium]
MHETYLLAGGVQTRCFSAGTGSPILLLHGFHGSADHFRWLAPQLAPRFTTHSIDLLGHGPSDWPRGPFRLADYGRHVLAVLDQLSLKTVLLLGNSLGGAVAMWVAINAPERVSSLVLLSPAGLGGTTPIGAAQFALGLLEVKLGIRTRAVAALSRRIQFSDAEAVDPEFFERKEADARRRRRGHHRLVTLEQSRTLAHLTPVDPSLIQQPTMIVWGEEDRALSWRRARHSIERFPAARLEVLARCGHLPHVERPEAVADLVMDFAAPPNR